MELLAIIDGALLCFFLFSITFCVSILIRDRRRGQRQRSAPLFGASTSSAAFLRLHEIRKQRRER